MLWCDCPFAAQFPSTLLADISNYKLSHSPSHLADHLQLCLVSQLNSLSTTNCLHCKFNDGQFFFISKRWSSLHSNFTVHGCAMSSVPDLMDSFLRRSACLSTLSGVNCKNNIPTKFAALANFNKPKPNVTEFSYASRRTHFCRFSS